jgi:cell division protein FtsW
VTVRTPPRVSVGRQSERASADRQDGWRAWLDAPVATYYVLLSATVALIVIGLVMVLSSSSVEAYRASGSSYTVFARQAEFAALGVPLMALAVRLPVRFWKALAWPMLLAALGALLLIFTPLGTEVNGNRNWLDFGGGFRVQPAEGAKLALVIWSASVLARKRPLLHRMGHVLVPVAPVAMLVIALVLAGHDLGTALVLMALTAALLYAAGAPLRMFALAGAAAALLVVTLVQGSSNRTGRISAWLNCSNEYYSSCWQTTHGKWALASGGWWGVGLGASREKWSWLPEAHNDFIFAIIGEELGLVGTLLVLALFAVLAIGLLRVVIRSQDLFVKVATGGVLTWVIGQAVVNIGAVLGLLPVVGVPLPLVSSGGSALVTTMIAVGMVIGFARREPGAAEALAARSGLVRRSLAVLPRRSHGRAGR